MHEKHDKNKKDEWQERKKKGDEKMKRHKRALKMQD